VLVVDDDPIIVKLLQVNFEMEGYQVISAADGKEGLARAQGSRPDLIILDVMMPGIGGLELARTLKSGAETHDIPIILLSAKAQASDWMASTCCPHTLICRSTTSEQSGIVVLSGAMAISLG